MITWGPETERGREWEILGGAGGSNHKVASGHISSDAYEHYHNSTLLIHTICCTQWYLNKTVQRKNTGYSGLWSPCQNQVYHILKGIDYGAI